MSGGFIIVERDLYLRDYAVFTGQIQMVETRLHFWDAERQRPLQSIDGVASADIEHAFVFNSAYTAWRMAMQFEPHWDADRRCYYGFRRWSPRKDGDFFPGECRAGAEVSNPCIHGRSWIPQEALIAATAAGYEQGRASVLVELQHTGATG